RTLRLALWSIRPGFRLIMRVWLPPTSRGNSSIMVQETQIQASFWERLVDSLGAFVEGLVAFLGRLFGSSNERLIRSLGYIRHRDGTYAVTAGSLLAQVNDLEDHMTALSDEELKAITPALRERLAQGETLEDVLPEAFAACREAARRTKNMRH